MSLIEQNKIRVLQEPRMLIEPNHTDGIARTKNGSQMPQRRIKNGEATKIVTVRMAESDYKLVQMRAKAASMTIADYIRLLVLDAERLRDYVSDAKVVTDKIQKVMASMDLQPETEDEEEEFFEGLGSLFE